MVLDGKCVVLGVTGGIAAYKACDIVRKLHKLGARVRVVMSENAAKFVSPLTFETLSGERAYVDGFERAWEIGHISLAKSADIMLVAPATANALGKFAAGIADDLLTTTFMAMPAPIFVAPAMNSVMWRSAANQANMATLVSRGVHVIGPESGLLACGDTDVGRMSEPDDIARAVEAFFARACDFEGKTVLVTAGPTREMLDPVRFLSNKSTGKMGYAICEAALARGARVKLVTGPVSIAPPADASVTHVTSTSQMLDAVMALVSDADVVIQSAAPADFMPECVSEQKIKKKGDALSLNLVPTPDIAMRVGAQKREGQVLVAFAAETENALSNAQAKRVKKNCDLIVANDVTKPGAGFGVDTNIVAILSDSGIVEHPMMTKRQVADVILDAVMDVIKCHTRK